MKIIYKYRSLILLLLLSCFTYSQEGSIKVKTTDFYSVNLPSAGEYSGGDRYVIWEIDLKGKIIRYKKGNNFFLFYYDYDELVKNNDSEITIKFENQKEAIYFSSYYNYIKISHYSKKDFSTYPYSFKQIEVYSNYVLDDFFKIMDYNIN